MKIFKLFPFLFIPLVWSSCAKDEPENPSKSDYLIFGHFYGECMGEECVEIFKLTDYKLYEDSKDNYPGLGEYSFHELANSKFEEVNDLVNFIPSELLAETKDVIGCPDCADQGGIYIEYVKNGVTKSWRIDNANYNTPNYLHDFMDKVREKIELLK